MEPKWPGTPDGSHPMITGIPTTGIPPNAVEGTEKLAEISYLQMEAS